MHKRLRHADECAECPLVKGGGHAVGQLVDRVIEGFGWCGPDDRSEYFGIFEQPVEIDTEHGALDPTETVG